MFSNKDMESNSNEINDWQSLVNRRVICSDGSQLGEVSSIQPEKLIVIDGSITVDKYLIPKASIKSFENGVVYLNESIEYARDVYKFE